MTEIEGADLRDFFGRGNEQLAISIAGATTTEIEAVDARDFFGRGNERIANSIADVHDLDDLDDLDPDVDRQSSWNDLKTLVARGDQTCCTVNCVIGV